MRAQPEAPSVGAAHVADEFDREFRAFIGSIAVTEEELVAIVNMPDYSIPQVKEYLRTGELTGDLVCDSASRSRPQRPRPARIRDPQAARPRAGVQNAAAPLKRDMAGARARGAVLHPVPKPRSSAATALPKR